MKKYGLIVADNGSNWYISGAPDPRWNDDTLGELKGIPGSAFEVVLTIDSQGNPIRPATALPWAPKVYHAPRPQCMAQFVNFRWGYSPDQWQGTVFDLRGGRMAAGRAESGVW
jgi:hypothetical protein